MHQASLGRRKRFDSRSSFDVDSLSRFSLGSTTSDRPVTSRTTKNEKHDEHDGITLKDIRLILPTLLILLFTLIIMVTVIPYAFASVFRQLEAVRALEERTASQSTSASGSESVTEALETSAPSNSSETIIL